MKPIISLFLITALGVPTAAIANEDSPFNGAHIGIEIDRDSNSARQPGAPKATKRVNRNGFGGRLFAGYDAAVTEYVLIGAEAGIGKGGRTIVQNSLVGGKYAIKPKLGYDVTGRIGFIPASNVVIYGRGGYRWLQTDRVISGQATGNGTTKLTEKGFTYGAGIEYALSENMALRAEYNRTNFSKDFKQNKVSVGASIRF